METLRLVNAKLMDLLSKMLEENQQLSKDSKAIVNQLRTENARIATKQPWLANPTKGLHLRTTSESNRFSS